MCNQAAGMSRCLTKVQDAMVAQLRTLQLDKGKGKAQERSQQVVDKLDRLVTFNRSIIQAMVHTMQDLSVVLSLASANKHRISPTLADRVPTYVDFINSPQNETI